LRVSTPLLHRLVSSRFVDSNQAIRLDRPPVTSTPVRWSHRVEYAVLRFLIGLFSSLPRPVALRVGAAITSFVYVVDWKRRRIGLHNLGLAFPEKSGAERREIAIELARSEGAVKQLQFRAIENLRAQMEGGNG